MIEKERKFILKGEVKKVKDNYKDFILKETTMIQYYLLTSKLMEVRMRMETNKGEKQKCNFTTKIPTPFKNTRIEFEIRIPTRIFNWLMNEHIILKKRTEFKLYHNAKTFIDEYYYPKYPPVVEVEWWDKMPYKMPNFAGFEVTNDKFHKNSYIAKTRKKDGIN